MLPAQQPVASGAAPLCTVIIPTLAAAERHSLLLRAIESTRRNQSPPLVLVVINGSRRSPEVIADLRARSGLRVLQLDQASLPAAIEAGRHAVATPFFSFVDDDDEYLPEAVDLRLS